MLTTRKTAAAEFFNEIGTKRTKAEFQLSIQKRSLLRYKSEAILRGRISLILTYPNSVRGYSRPPACGGQL